MAAIIPLFSRTRTTPIQVRLRTGDGGGCGFRAPALGRLREPGHGFREPPARQLDGSERQRKDGVNDRTLHCVDCGEDFPFTAAEQEFFRDQGFENDPKRCPACRRARKKARGQRGRPRSDAPRGPRPVKVHRVRGGEATHRAKAPARQVQMHDAVCSQCGAETQVPFVPDGVRPVFCLPCLKTTTR